MTSVAGPQRRLRQLVTIVELPQGRIHSQHLERLLLELPHPLGTDSKRIGHFIEGVRALVGDVERAIAIGRCLVLPVAAVREVVATLAMGTGALVLGLDAFLDARIARLSTASPIRLIPAQSAEDGQNCAPFWAS